MNHRRLKCSDANNYFLPPFDTSLWLLAIKAKFQNYRKKLCSVTGRQRGIERYNVAIFFLFLICMTEFVTPNFKPPPPFRLSKLEKQMGEFQEPMSEAFNSLLEDYIRWHEIISNSSQKLKFVRILAWNGIGDSGLGDKIRGILHALMLSIETGRYFVIEDVPEFPIQKLVTAGKIKWDTEVDLRGEPMFNWRTSFSRGRRGVKRLTEPHFEVRHRNHRVVRLASSTYPMYERTVSTAYWRFACRRLKSSTRRDKRCGYLGEQNIYFNRKLYSALFKLRPSTKSRVSDILAKLPDKNIPFVAIHARLGGKFRREARTKRFADLNHDWSKTAQRLLHCAYNRTGTIYLATDDERFKSVFQAEALRAGRHVVMSPIFPRHSGTVSLDEIPEALRNTLAEGLVIGKAHTLITTGSGLATFAAFTGKSDLILIDECSDTNNHHQNFLNDERE